MATYSYFKNGKVRLLKDPDLTDIESDEEDNQDTEQKQTNDVFWCWESDDGYLPYDLSVSQKLEQINIGQIYKLFINNTNYEIKKTAFNKAIQTNMNNGLYRKVIRQSNNNNNNIENKTENNQTTQSNNKKDNVKELQYVWFYSLNTGALESCDYNTSIQLNKLKIGGLYKTHINGTQYVFTKSENDLCQQRNGKTNQTQTVIRQSIGNKYNNTNNNHKNNNNNNNNEIDEYRKNKNNPAWKPPDHHYNQHINNINKNKWYWKDDYGKWKSFSNDISARLSSLAVMKSIKISIKNSQYKMTKFADDIVQQKNIDSGNKREVRRNVKI